MDYIFSVLGYKDELFSKYDSRRGGVDRFANKRTERIGKKYQYSALKNSNFMGRWFPEAGTVYQLYVGEYVWAPAARDLIDEWQECGRDKEMYGFVMPATLEFRWEAEQDASQSETVSITMPCMSLIKTLGLTQKEYNGCFYDSDGNLIAFDARPLGLGSSLWFRKNEMLRYIREAGYVLFWTCFGEKQFFTGGWGRQISGDWSGFYYLDKDGNITGNNRFFE